MGHTVEIIGIVYEQAGHKNHYQRYYRKQNQLHADIVRERHVEVCEQEQQDGTPMSMGEVLYHSLNLCTTVFGSILLSEIIALAIQSIISVSSVHLPDSAPI